jgi:hypothetical protein
MYNIYWCCCGDLQKFVGKDVVLKCKHCGKELHPMFNASNDSIEYAEKV